MLHPTARLSDEEIAAVTATTEEFRGREAERLKKVVESGTKVNEALKSMLPPNIKTIGAPFDEQFEAVSKRSYPHLTEPQNRVLQSQARVTLMCGDRATGKTFIQPRWMRQKIAELGAGDYLVLSTNYRLLRDMIFPEFAHAFDWGEFAQKNPLQIRLEDSVIRFMEVEEYLNMLGWKPKAVCLWAPEHILLRAGLRFLDPSLPVLIEVMSNPNEVEVINF